MNSTVIVVPKKTLLFNVRSALYNSATFKEYLDDYASAETKMIGEQLIQSEMNEIRNSEFYQKRNMIPTIEDYLQRIANGENDLYL